MLEQRVAEEDRERPVAERQGAHIGHDGAVARPRRSMALEIHAHDAPAPEARERVVGQTADIEERLVGTRPAPLHEQIPPPLPQAPGYADGAAAVHQPAPQIPPDRRKHGTKVILIRERRGTEWASMCW